METTSTYRQQAGSTDDIAPAELRGVIESLDVAVLAVDRRRTICYRNGRAAQWLAPAEHIEDAFASLRILGGFEGWADECQAVLDQQSTRRFECAPVSRGPTVSGGAPPPALLSVRCMPWHAEPTRPPRGVIVVIEDASQRVGLEERLAVAQRLATLGKLATRVAHELNNPLDGILRYVNLAMRLAQGVAEPKLRTYLDESRTGLIRMVQIISELLEFSRSTQGQFDVTGVNDVVEQAIRAHAARAEQGRVILAADFHQQDMPGVRGPRLFQVCSNLIKNAIDAMPDGGRLTVTTGLVGREVVIRVADTGIGLPDPPHKVFEPFYTTKPAGQGTGLGLAICKDFVEDMGGRIEGANQRDGGAVFTVRLPVDRCTPPGAPTGERPESRAGAAPTEQSLSRREPESGGAR
jgi:signal transduction histidine kinase